MNWNKKCECAICNYNTIESTQTLTRDDWTMIESDNARDDALRGFFSCGSEKRLGGFWASNLDALGVGWEERIFHFCFPSSGVRFLFYVYNS